MNPFSNTTGQTCFPSITALKRKVDYRILVVIFSFPRASHMCVLVTCSHNTSVSYPHVVQSGNGTIVCSLFPDKQYICAHYPMRLLLEIWLGVSDHPFARLLHHEFLLRDEDHQVNDSSTNSTFLVFCCLTAALTSSEKEPGPQTLTPIHPIWVAASFLTIDAISGRPGNLFDMYQ